jgi:hypothetical protein
MGERKPRSLKWYDAAPEDDFGIDGKLPNCGPCRELVDNRWFTEAVYSVSAEAIEDPADVARSTVERYHARGHPAGGWGLE